MIKIHCRRKILHLPTNYSHEIQIKKGHFLQSKFSKKLQNLVYSMNAATHSSLCNKFLCVSDCPENDNNHASTYIRSSRPINYNLAKKSGKKIKIFEALNLLKKIGWWEKEHQFQMLVGAAQWGQLLFEVAIWIFSTTAISSSPPQLCYPLSCYFYNCPILNWVQKIGS